jgi:putative flippase GtrA
VKDRIGLAINQDVLRIGRYLLIGVMAWVIDVAVFVACVADLGIVKAQLIARIIGALVSFAGHKLFVFSEMDTKPATVARQAAAYGALWILSYFLSTLGLIGLIDYGGIHSVPAKVMVEMGVVVMNYLVTQRLIFRSGSSKG